MEVSLPLKEEVVDMDGRFDVCAGNVALDSVLNLAA